MPFRGGRLEWFHPEIEASDTGRAKELLQHERFGSFLVMSEGADNYVIVYKDIIGIEKLFIVKKENGKFAIGMEWMEFNSIDNLITYYWGEENSTRTKKPLIHAVPFREMLNMRSYVGYMTRNAAESYLKPLCVGSVLYRDSTTQFGKMVYSLKISESPVVQFNHVLLINKDRYGMSTNALEKELEFTLKISLIHTMKFPGMLFPVNRDKEQEQNLPPEIMKLDYKSRELFKKALQEGKDRCYNVRIIVIGHFGAGKTTLTKRLIGDDFDIRTVRSTNGVDIFTISCTVAKDGSWEIEKPSTADKIHLQRMRDTVKRFPYQKLNNQAVEKLEVKSGQTYTDVQSDVSSDTFHDPLVFHTSSDKDYLDCDYDDLDCTSEENEEDDLKQSRESLIQDDLEKVVTNCNESQTNPAMLSIWDFAGQAIFYITHLAFLSRRAQYILVTDINRLLNDVVEDEDFSSIGGKETKMKIKDFIKFWVNVICPFGSTDGNGFPKVFLAATHKDKLKYIQGVKEQILLDHFRDIRNLFEGTPAEKHIFGEDFCIDCSDPNDNCVKYLRKKIFDIAKEESQWGEEIPSSWMFMERRLRQEKQNGRFLISMDEIKTINEKETVQISSEEQLEVFLRFQHAIGEILFFSEDELKDFIILDPQWLIDSFKCIITAKSFVQSNNELWDKLYNEAKLHPELIEIVWSKHPDKKFLENKNFLLMLLTKIEIIAKPKTYNDGKDICQKFYFVPCMLGEAPNGLPERIFATSQIKIRPLCFVFCHNFLPPAVFFRLLASCLQRFSIASYENASFLYTKVAVFRIDLHTLFALEHLNNIIRLQIIGNSNNLSMGMLSGLRKFIFETISNITEFYTPVKQNALFTPAFQCNQGCKLYINSNNKVVCQKQSSLHTVPSDDQWLIEKDYVCLPPNLPWKSCQSQKSEDSKAYCLDVEPSFKELGRIARRIGAENEIVGIELGLQKYEIDQLKMTYKDLITDVNFQILKNWKIRMRERGTFAKLKYALYSAGCNMDVIIQHFLDRIPSDEEMSQIALTAGYEYQQLAIELELEPQRIEQLRMDISRTYDRVLAILKQWRTNRTIHATYYHLCNAMAEVVMDLSVLQAIEKMYFED